MKWIGQHIWEYLARFRELVYFEKGIEVNGNISQTSGDYTLYDAVNDANPFIRIGSTAAESLGITVNYNSGTQTLEKVTFDTATASGTTDYGKFVFNIDGTDMCQIDDYGFKVQAANKGIRCTDTTTGSATTGGALNLNSDDGAATGGGHRLGVIKFRGAEDGASTMTVGARIEAITDAAGWSASENGASLHFYTTDGNASESEVLKLDSDKLATFAGAGTFASKVTIGNPATSTGLELLNNGASSASAGGILRLTSDDESPMGSGHRLGVIEFVGADDGSNNHVVGARIESLCDALWESEVENGASLHFFTTDGAASQSRVLQLDSNKKATFSGEVSVGSAGLTMDSVTLTTIQTGSEAFSDNDTSVMTSAAVQDKIQAHFTYVYLHVQGKSTNSTDNWNFPSLNGWNNVTWSEDSSLAAWDGGSSGIDNDGTNTTVNSSTFAITRTIGAQALVVPHDCTLIGFKAIGRDNSGNDPFKAGLWSATPEIGNTGSTTYTLRAVATASYSGGSGSSYNGICRLDDLTRSHSLSAGDVLLPAISEYDSSTHYVSMTVVLKVPIV